MKTAILAYLPSAGSRFNPEAFLVNLRENPPASPLLFFSDHHEWIGRKDFPDSNFYSIRQPESVIKNTPTRKFNVSNLLFLTGLKLLSVNLADQGFTHFVWLEMDCRVQGKGWDQWIIDEFQERIPLPVDYTNGEYEHLQEFVDAKDEPIVGGTVCLYSGFTGEAQKRADALVAKNTRKNFPVAQYRGGAGFGPCCFAMGAGAIYSIQGVKGLFDESELANHAVLAANMHAWDLEIGLRVFEKYGAQSFDKIVHLDTIYSSYDQPKSPTTETERLQMLKDGSRVLIHQVKGAK